MVNGNGLREWQSCLQKQIWARNLEYSNLNHFSHLENFKYLICQERAEQHSGNQLLAVGKKADTIATAESLRSKAGSSGSSACESLDWNRYTLIGSKSDSSEREMWYIAERGWGGINISRRHT